MTLAPLTLLPLALLPLALLVGCGGTDLDERVAAAPGGHLELDLDRGVGWRPDPGELVVRGYDAAEVRVVVEASEWGASGVRFRIDRSGDTARVIGRVGGATAWMFGGPRIEVRIWVPHETSLDLRCSAGAIRVEDTVGAIRARTDGAPIELARTEGEVKLRSNGDVRLAEVVGDVDVRVESGDIDASWIRGGVELRTGSGEIEVSHVEGEVVARSDRGSITLRELEGGVEAVTERGGVYASFAAAPSGRLETSRGSVDVELPPLAGADLEAISRRGSVEIAPGLDLKGERGEGHVRGPLNGGGAPLRLFTARGTVNLRAR